MAEEKKEQQPQVVVGSMPYRVSMAEVDAYGVMYYSRFFELFERGRTELFRALGIEYRQILQQKQILMPVVEAACRYMAPVVYDDLITLETAITNIGTRGIRFDYRVLRDDVVLAVGFTQHIFIDPQGRPVSFGKEVFNILKEKGVITGEPPKDEEGQQQPQQAQPQEDVTQKLKNFIIERTEGKDN
ncbi:acyl-CoA thioesterase [Thermovibrio ammonificans]|jgi:acyl-CoA thioester hydrolase|uniref:Thioesterase superfamily protein n=1 Tax=Thermovibrio ammonificans (strain DSM 15698 / JCM 12110 / HB-1) TaxID=648996 RepID=E8T4Z2_THEA1|nr:thioesterase family protein [Thermovibrio ammonificans]ADU97524.1 thioesterase superfamily protein [Thermovibrio ammonificans HB-1]